MYCNYECENCPLYRIAECPLFRVSNVLKSMGKLSGHSELSTISWVSAAEGHLLCGIPLYTSTLRELKHEPSPHLVYTFGNAVLGT